MKMEVEEGKIARAIGREKGDGLKYVNKTDLKWIRVGHGSG